MEFSTALGAFLMRDSKTQSIIFINEEHKEFFDCMLQKSMYTDCYHKALFYTLGINPDTRNHVNEIYDFSKWCIKPECISSGWQTSGTLKTTRLAFNLFTDGVPTKEEFENNYNEQLCECRKYSVSDLFCCDYAIYFIQAICLRYPEYMKWGTIC